MYLSYYPLYTFPSKGCQNKNLNAFYSASMIRDVFQTLSHNSKSIHHIRLVNSILDYEFCCD